MRHEEYESEEEKLRELRESEESLTDILKGLAILFCLLLFSFIFKLPPDLRKIVLISLVIVFKFFCDLSGIGL